MQEVVQFAALGLGLGGINALLALGLIVIYRGAGILNLAQGGFAVAGGYAFVQLFEEANLPVGVGVLGACVVGAILGGATHLLIMRPLRQATSLVRLIATLGILTVIQQAALLKYGGRTINVTQFLPNAPLNFPGDITVGRDRVLLLCIAVGLATVIWIIYRTSRFGKVTTAGVESQQLIAANGWSPDVIASLNWVVGGALGGLAGALMLPLSGVRPGLGVFIVLPALAAALLGRFRSFPICVGAALVLGMGESVMARYVSIPGAARSLPFIVIAIVLAIGGTAMPLRDDRFERLPVIGTAEVRPRTIVLGFAAFVALAWWQFSANWLDAFTTMTGMAIIVLSLVLLTGYAGQVSLGQFAMAGIGAFIAGRIVAESNIPFEVAAIIGILGTMPVALIFALPALRTRGVNLAVITFGLGLVVWLVVFNNSDYTGGQLGTQVGSRTLFGIDVNATARPERYLAFTAAVLVLMMLLVRNVRRSKLGRQMISIRSNERAAASIGVNVVAVKLFAFMVASGIAALGGIMLAFRRPSIVYRDFDPFTSITIVLLGVIGGIGFVGGPLLGVLLVAGGLSVILRDWLSDVERYVALAGGILLLVTVIANPDGMGVGVARLGKTAGRVLDRRTKKDVGAVLGGTSVLVAAQGTAEHEGSSIPAKRLEVRDIRVSFGGVTAVDGVSLSVEPGEILGIIGPNGAGKTTLLDAITGYASLDNGEVTLDGESLTRYLPTGIARLGVRRSFQEADLFEELTVEENLLAACDSVTPADYFITPFRRPVRQLPPLAIALAESLGLMSSLAARPRDLSYGDRRLVSIVRAAASGPSVLLLDEPAAGLGAVERRHVSTAVKHLAHDRGMAIALIEHDVSLVLETCDRVAVIEFGQLIAMDVPEAIRLNPAVVEAYLGAGAV